MRVENLQALTQDIARLNRLRDGGKRVVARAASTLKRRLVPFAKRDIGAQYALASREIGKHLGCNGDASSVTFTARDSNMPLIKFKGVQNATGVTAQVEKGAAVSISHAFIQIPHAAPGAGPQVMIRENARSTLPGKVRTLAVVIHDRSDYPILVLGGPSVADMLRDAGREDRLSDFAQQTFAAEVDRLAEYARG